MIGRSILSYLPVNMANVLTAFGTIAILTRLLEPEQFGIYAVAMITMQFVHMALFTWLEAAMVRFQARAERENDVADHLVTLYRLALITGIAGFTLIMTVLYFSPLDEMLVFVLAFALSSTCLHIIFSLGMEAHKVLAWKPIKPLIVSNDILWLTLQKHLSASPLGFSSFLQHLYKLRHLF